MSLCAKKEELVTSLFLRYSKYTQCQTTADLLKQGFSFQMSLTNLKVLRIILSCFKEDISQNSRPLRQNQNSDAGKLWPKEKKKKNSNATDFPSNDVW